MIMSSRTVSAVLVVAGVLSGAAGCASTQKAEDESQCKMVKPGEITTVNSMCVVVNDDPVNPAVEPAVWKGQKVGFCCNGCKPRWNAMSDSEKDAALARAVAASK